MNRVNRCRPGFDASCSFCCGSHNYIITEDEIDELFISRGKRGVQIPLLHQEYAEEKKLVMDGMQCPHIGKSVSESDTLCCLIYNEDLRGDVGSFFEGTCRQFFCAAWDDLTDEEVIFAAKLTGDWYYYSLLINSPELLKNIFAEYSAPRNVPEERFSELKDELLERLLAEDLI